MDEDDYYYLAPDFEPSTLTVPRLRNILLTHDVDYPSNAKKPQLLQLFDDEVKPQAKKLLSAAKRVKRSNRGIVDVPSSQASTVDEDELPEPEPEPAPRRGGRRKTTQRINEDPDATLLAPDTARSRRATTRSTRSAEPVPVEPEPEPELAPAPVTKRGRGRPSKTPLKREESDPPAWHKEGEDSPFTADNPFQSGGSSPPPTEARAPSRRKTVDPTTTTSRKSTSSRRRTDGVVPTGRDKNVQSSAFEVPVNSVRRKTPAIKQESPEPELPGEEFEPEEALELARQEASGQIVRQPRRAATNSSSLIMQAILWPAVIALLLGGGLWTQEKFSVGYCGVGNNPRTDVGGVEIPEWADILRPQCEPCPPHALCYQNLETQCAEGFVVKPHPLTIQGMLPLPLPPMCVPDGEKARKVQFVTDRAVELLRERNAAYECNEPMTDHALPPPSPGMAIEEIKETLSAKRSKRMSEEEFDNLFKEAIGEIEKRDEIVPDDSKGANAGSGTNILGGGGRHIRSTSRAKQSLSCAVRTSLRALVADVGRSVRAKLVEYFWTLILIASLAGSGFEAKRRITWHSKEEDWAKDLARQAFDRLSTQASLHAEDPDAYPEPFLLVSHLRDQILNEDIGKAWVRALWAKVMAKVKRNSNVRELNQEMRKGDYGLTWEWIGPLTALPDSGEFGSGFSGVSRRRSGYRSNRQSMLPPASSPLSGLSTMPNQQEYDAQPEMSERKWEESRPIY